MTPISNKDAIYETTNYMVVVEPGLYAETPWKGFMCYRMYNKNTGVAEGEGAVLAWAIRSCHSSEKFIAEVMADPDGRQEAIAGSTQVDPLNFD